MAGLGSEIQVGGLKLKNRLVMPPMATENADEDGNVSERLLHYYDEKSRGSYLGLIITEHSFIASDGRASSRQVSVASDDKLDGLKKLTDVIHRNGVKVACQINHAGGNAQRNITGLPTMAPSAVLPDGSKFADRSMTKTDIQTVIQEFADAALRAKKAGYDAVEIHSAHGYLLNEFYSPLTNNRNDEYGGDLPGRIRIHLETINAVKGAVGNDYPVFIRLGSIDDVPGGSNRQEAAEASKVFEKAGVSLIDISGGVTGYIRKGKEHVQGYFSDVSEAVKREVSVPVLVTGGITDPQAAGRIIRENKADLVGVGRAILKDSEWPKKAFEGGIK